MNVCLYVPYRTLNHAFHHMMIFINAVMYEPTKVVSVAPRVVNSQYIMQMPTQVSQVGHQVGYLHIFKLIILYNIRDQSWRRGTKCDCKIDQLWVRYPLEDMKYLFQFILSFLRSSVEAKRGVEFRHSTCNIIMS